MTGPLRPRPSAAWPGKPWQAAPAQPLPTGCRDNRGAVPSERRLAFHATLISATPAPVRPRRELRAPVGRRAAGSRRRQDQRPRVRRRTELLTPPLVAGSFPRQPVASRRIEAAPGRGKALHPVPFGKLRTQIRLVRHDRPGPGIRLFVRVSKAVRSSCIRECQLQRFRPVELSQRSCAAFNLQAHTLTSAASRQSDSKRKIAHCYRNGSSCYGPARAARLRGNRHPSVKGGRQ